MNVALRCQRLDHRFALAENIGQRQPVHHDRKTAGLDLREVENLIDQRQQMAPRFDDVTDERGLLFARSRRAVGGVEQLAEADDRVQRRAQFVAHVRQELALRAVGALGGDLGDGELVVRHAQLRRALEHALLELVVQPQHPRLGLLLLGHVLHRAEPAGRPFGVTVERLDHLLQVNDAAVGADQAVLDIDASAGHGGLERLGAKRGAIVGVQQLVHPLARRARHLLRVQADQRRQALRPALERAAQAGDHMAQARHQLCPPQAGLAFAQCRLGAHPLGHVDRADETRASAHVDHFVRGDFDVDQRAVLEAMAPDA